MAPIKMAERCRYDDYVFLESLYRVQQQSIYSTVVKRIAMDVFTKVLVSIQVCLPITMSP